VEPNIDTRDSALRKFVRKQPLVRKVLFNDPKAHKDNSGLGQRGGHMPKHKSPRYTSPTSRMVDGVMQSDTAVLETMPSELQNTPSGAGAVPESPIRRVAADYTHLPRISMFLSAKGSDSPSSKARNVQTKEDNDLGAPPQNAAVDTKEEGENLLSSAATISQDLPSQDDAQNQSPNNVVPSESLTEASNSPRKT